MDSERKQQKTLSTVNFPLLFALAILSIVGLLPLLGLLARAFTQDGGFSLRRFAELFGSLHVWRSLAETAAGAGIAAAVALALGLPYALVVSRWAIPARRTLLGLSALPLLIPLHVHTMAWLDLTATSETVSAILTESPGFGGALLVAGAIHGLALMPLVVWFSAVGLSATDAGAEDAARLDGTRAQVLAHVTLPAASPGIVAGALAVFSLALVGYEVPGVLGLNSYTFEIFARFNTAWDYGAAAVMGLPLVAIVAALAFAAWRWIRRRGGLDLAAVWSPRSLRRASPGQSMAGLAVTGGVLAVSVGLPLLALVRRADWSSLARDSLHPGISLWQRLEVDALVRTVGLSALVALVALALTLPVGYRVMRGGPRWRAVWPLIAAPLAVSPAILGIALILFWNRSGILGEVIYGGWPILVIGGLARFAPVALLASAAATARVPRELEEAAAVDGASRLGIAWHILRPLSASILIAGALATFVLMMGESGVSVLVKPPGWSTYPIEFMSLVHGGFVALLSSMALLQLLVCLAPAIAVALFALKLND